MHIVDLSMQTHDASSYAISHDVMRKAREVQRGPSTLQAEPMTTQPLFQTNTKVHDLRHQASQLSGRSRRQSNGRPSTRLKSATLSTNRKATRRQTPLHAAPQAQYATPSLAIPTKKASAQAKKANKMLVQLTKDPPP